MQGVKGKDNPKWNGGVSEYPNHYEMKKNRLIKLKEVDGKCEACGEDAYCVHHLDGSNDNHQLDNLAVLCKKCHSILHAGRENNNHSQRLKTSKYIRLYGMTLSEMANQYGGTVHAYHCMHNKNTLKSFIKSQQGETE